MHDPDQDGILNAIREADRAGAAAIIDAWAAGRSYESAVLELLAPALESFGESWARSDTEASLAQGYVASKIAEDLLEKVLLERRQDARQGPATRGPVVLGNILDDFHPLGRKMVSAFLRIAGWEVIDLGVDVSPEEFLDQAEAAGARVIGASAMMFSTARNILLLRQEIERRGRTGRVQLAVGGAVFKLRPELVAAFGGDGTAASALQAPALFEDLWNRSLACEGSGRE
jgi:methanogenic corrinoid protein MtbC1